MKKTLLTLTIVIAAIFGSSAVLAGDTSAIFSAPSPKATSLFDEEIQLNLGGSYRNNGSADYAVDFGAAYFLNETFGVSANLSWLGDDYEAWDYEASLNAIYRYPIEDLRLAPYAFAGVGVTFGGDVEDFYQAGVGLDYRVYDDLRLYIEAAQQWVPDYDDFTVIRAGVGFVF